MAEIKNEFPTYKGKPLVRSGDVLYYGDMKDKYVIKMQIKSKETFNDMEVANKVSIQLLSTDINISPRKAVIKTSEKPNLYLALDIADVWLQKALKEAASAN